MTQQRRRIIHKKKSKNSRNLRTRRINMHISNWFAQVIQKHIYTQQTQALLPNMAMMMEARTIAVTRLRYRNIELYMLSSDQATVGYGGMHYLNATRARKFRVCRALAIR